jgi:hypothetical protein
MPVAWWLPVCIFNYLIFNELNNVPCFLARQGKAFARTGLARLMTAHAQTYPQLLGINAQHWRRSAANCRLPHLRWQGRIRG